jgi:hypothetical protein
MVRLKAESYGNSEHKTLHKHYNEQFYASRPSMFVFRANIMKLQATIYIKLHSTNVGSRPALYITKRVHSTRSRKW